MPSNMLKSGHQNAEQDHTSQTATKSFQNVVNFKYFGTTATNQNAVHEESRLNSENACCHPVQNLLSSHLLSKNVKIKLQVIIILSVVLYGCETWSLTQREERGVRRIFGPETEMTA
jgi:hypothetical protein